MAEPLPPRNSAPKECARRLATPLRDEVQQTRLADASLANKKQARLRAGGDHGA